MGLLGLGFRDQGFQSCARLSHSLFLVRVVGLCGGELLRICVGFLFFVLECGKGSVRGLMDREWGSKPGSGGAASAQNEAVDRRERLRRLALETIDLAKDPYFMRNHLGR